MITRVLIFSSNTLAEDPPVGEEEFRPVEIKPEEGKPLEEMKEAEPVSEIREEKEGIPEIPKAITREQLSPAEEAQLSELELKRAKGKITETEYELEKDSLARQANIKF